MLDSYDSPDVQPLVAVADLQRAARARERSVEAVVALLVVGAAVWLALRHLPAPSTGSLMLSVLTIALCAQVQFEVGAGIAVPVQLAFVTVLFVVGPGWAPAAAIAGLLVARAMDVLRGETPPAGLPLALADGAFSLGPALVLLAAGSPHPSDIQPWALAAALGAQIAVSLTVSTLRSWAADGASPATHAQMLLGVYAVDVALSPIAFVVALPGVHNPSIMLATIPLAGLLGVFARERRERLDRMLELGAAYRGTALLLAEVLELDDPYTARHSHGVVELAVAVAEHMGLDSDGRRNVEFAALLHDVGKIRIPESILNKPAALDDREWRIMQRHVVDGERMLLRVGGVLAEAGRIVRSSHERWDGNGYPDGLRGDEIPLEARIVSCCDAYSAMTTDRPYRPAIAEEEAFAELRRCAGTQFDPAVVDALLAVVAVPRVESAAVAALAERAFAERVKQ